ncbi:hypothetical protein [Shimazuella kribbensis]|uniref:hypothetical protein n=1 Tax=Shimazuella kribbensis TaxID=139808 RepID=UPI00041E290F|nr:hypothetical protein [Shimazuella kribbensis]
MENHHHHHHTTANNTNNTLNVKVDYQNEIITIDLKDNENNPPELEINHEKRLHLIVVSADLKEYYHLHPIDKGNGIFEQAFKLKDNAYKVFVDIQPKNIAYHNKAIELEVGQSHSVHHIHPLEVDTTFVKSIDNKTVELTIDSLGVHQNTTFRFDSKNGKPDPYLGALGHVVILDESAETFIHVHPKSENETVFETHFMKPGIYKLWGEFKFGEQVHAYPFVIEVK